MKDYWWGLVPERKGVAPLRNPSRRQQGGARVGLGVGEAELLLLVFEEFEQDLAFSLFLFDLFLLFPISLSFH